jgi:hypothetical protein
VKRGGVRVGKVRGEGKGGVEKKIHLWFELMHGRGGGVHV